MRREKRYKSADPIETVDRIKGLLADRLGITLKVQNFKEKNGLFFSAQVVAETETLHNLPNFTNGKGMTREFSLASAHAEFMERLQNSILFDNNYFFSEKFS